MNIIEWVDGEKVIRELTTDEVAALKPKPTTLATEARAKRNTLLTASDWTQVADAPVDQAVWATYRQALRDVPDQAGFPENIDWPSAPE